MSNLSQFFSGGIKSVQRGTTSVQNTTVNVTISPVNLSKTIVISSCRSNLAYGVYGSTDVFFTATATASLTSTTNLQIQSNTAFVGASPIVTVSWEVVEFK